MIAKRSSLERSLAQQKLGGEGRKNNMGWMERSGTESFYYKGKWKT
jgi:hypothetical protein